MTNPAAKKQRGQKRSDRSSRHHGDGKNETSGTDRQPYSVCVQNFDRAAGA
jgi:hypothetical protein